DRVRATRRARPTHAVGARLRRPAKKLVARPVELFGEAEYRTPFLVRLVLGGAIAHHVDVVRQGVGYEDHRAAECGDSDAEVRVLAAVLAEGLVEAAHPIPRRPAHGDVRAPDRGRDGMLESDRREVVEQVALV